MCRGVILSPILVSPILMLTISALILSPAVIFAFSPSAVRVMGTKARGLALRERDAAQQQHGHDPHFPLLSISLKSSGRSLEPRLEAITFPSGASSQVAGSSPSHLSSSSWSASNELGRTARPFTRPS